MMYVVYTTKNIKCGLRHRFKSHYFAWLHLPAPSPQTAGAPVSGDPASRARGATHPTLPPLPTRSLHPSRSPS